jgi:hypothetical protein
MTDLNHTRYRTLKSTGGRVFFTVCCKCEKTPAPYGYNHIRTTGSGKWVKGVWLGKPPTDTLPTASYYCKECKPCETT